MFSKKDLETAASEIEKTGFPLEYRVATDFEKNGWVIISNKFYLDDIQQVPREIDLIAYKSSQVGHLTIYTAVIISCKKSEEYAWALLSKAPDLTNPNTDWWPLNVWSNDKAVNFEIADPIKKQKYYKTIISRGVTQVIEEPVSEIFAFQEMKQATGKTNNDKFIFSSVNSLLQAQAYELGVLPERKKEPSVYQFNLLSVLDGE